VSSPQDDIGSKAPYCFNQIRVDPNNEKNIFVTGVSLASSTDGGRTWYDLDWPPKRLFKTIYGDVRTLWIDPQNSDRLIMGSDGGVYMSYDGGKTCDHFYNLPLGEWYAIGADMDDPYNIYGGLQDHESWKGPSNSWAGKVTQNDWIVVGSGDGAHNQPDPFDSRWLYNTSTGGGLMRVDQKLGTAKSIDPRREPGKLPYRFVWNTPIHVSPHNGAIIYTGGQFLLRSLNRGDNWQEISPDLSSNDATKMVGSGRGGITWFAITTISESPLTAGVIWVGTSDGKVQMTKDFGANWTDMTPKITAAGGREDCYVSRVFASHFQAGTAYVAKSGYRNDDFRPFLYKTTDFGASWTPIIGNLPAKPVNVVFEDKKNPDLLFVGNDAGVYVSINAGKTWVRMNNNVPNVPVHDLLVHPRENDLVLGTYGRGLFVTDITPIQEMSDKTLAEEAYLFKIKPKAQRMDRTYGGNYYLFGDRHLATDNDPEGVVINYYLKTKGTDKAKITITDPYGTELAKLEGKMNAGMNTVLWDMRKQLTKEEAAAARMRRSDNSEARLVPPGEYVVILEVGAKKLTQKAVITKRVGWPIGPATEIIR